MNTAFNDSDRHSLSSKVFLKIRDSILDGTYKSGDALIETKLAEELNVSRTPIREAIRQLELEELVICIPNRGVFVQSISDQDIEDIYTIRKLLEGQVARWVCERISNEQMNRLSEIVELMELYTRRDDKVNLARLDTEFHDLLYEACKSRTLRHTLTTIHHNSAYSRLGNFTVAGRAKLSLNEHRAIFEAIEKHNADAASQLIIYHIESAYQASKAQAHDNT